MDNLKDISLREGKASDHEKVIGVMPEWWEGRDLTAMLPMVFFVHFYKTIFIAESKNQLVGFLVGFFSQSDENVGYIHFVGVHPDYRVKGIARLLYQKFYEACTEKDRHIIKSCTSPINKLSIAFHLGLGFSIEPGDGLVDGVAVTSDFLGKNEPKVLFYKELVA